MQEYNFQCRKALPSDDVVAIARHLHLTDPYIYPKVCKNPIGKNWVEFVGNCMKTENNIFNIQHLSVILDNNDVVGVVCVIPCGIKLCITDGIDNISEDFINNLNPVIEGYFHPLIDESFSYHGYNITNICVDRDYRNKGLGHLLMTHCIDTCGSKIIHLDVIASNKPAISLYKKFGFTISKEYYGYSGDDTELLCYHMIRLPNK